MRALSFFCAGLLSLAAVTAAPAADFTVPVDDRFSQSSIQFTGELGYVYYFAWAVFSDQGKFAICGAGALNNQRVRTLVPKMARAGEVRTAGKTYKVDLNFFTKVDGRENVGKAVANCQFVGPDPGEAADFELRFGRGTFRG